MATCDFLSNLPHLLLSFFCDLQQKDVFGQIKELESTKSKQTFSPLTVRAHLLENYTLLFTLKGSMLLFYK
jgi:hypothetical protein